MKLKLPHLWNPHKIKNNHSRRTDGVTLAANLPTAPFLSYALGGQSPPNEKHLVTFDSELRQLKSNKKPMVYFVFLV
ncbi:hypothetical protein [Prevotella dentalis]|uniref:hypothetical protein n=1 Tax=Prevotella dentalis TaxID=52227 RepID=UPI000A92FC53|nr:hypothetical protein [Prevotella dentalis]